MLYHDSGILYQDILFHTITIIFYTMSLYPIPCHCKHMPYRCILYHVIISYTMSLYTYAITVVSYTMSLYPIPCHCILYHVIVYICHTIVSYTMSLYPIPCHCIHTVISYTMSLYTYAIPLYPIPCHYILYHVIVSYTMSLYTHTAYHVTSAISVRGFKGHELVYELRVLPTATWYVLAIMANRRRRQQQQQEQQQALSPPQLQAISVAVTDAVTQALQRPGSSPNPQLAGGRAGPAPLATTPIASSVTTARYCSV